LQYESFEAGSNRVDGRADSPSYSFWNDPDTGLFLKDDGQIGVSVGGVEVGTFTSAGFVPSTGGGLGAAFGSNPVHAYAGGVVPVSTTSGTDTTPSATEEYLSEVIIPANVTVTGISILNGSAVTDDAIVILRDINGVALAQSAATTQSGTAAFQRIPFTAAYAAKGPGKYFIGLRFDGTTSRFRSQVFGDHNAGKVTGLTFATVGTVTPPSTFTASLGPIAMLY
jgi:hypothetical protein